MARVAVIGGHGFYGARVVAVLLRAGHDAVAASRSSRVLRIDLADSTTFSALAGFDAVVNASDSVKAPPDALARWCLDNGQVLFDMVADLPTAERLLDLPHDNVTGHVVVGVGVFPGLSTALAMATWRAAGEPGPMWPIMADRGRGRWGPTGTDRGR